MKSFNFTFLLFFLMIFAARVKAQENPREKGLEAITKEAVQGQLEFLASDWTQGRATGMPGEYMAADFIASMFKIYGLKPGGDMEVTKISHYEEEEGKNQVRRRPTVPGGVAERRVEVRP